jgi:hypothetical protein
MRTLYNTQNIFNQNKSMSAEGAESGGSYHASASIPREGFFSNLLGINNSNGIGNKLTNVAGRAAIVTLATYGVVRMFKKECANETSNSMSYTSR